MNEMLTESFLNKTNSLLSNYTPLRKTNKYKLKFQSKPWMTTGLQKSISVKNKFLTNFIKKKDPTKKSRTSFAIQKPQKPIINLFEKKGKENYYKKYFESNWNNVKIIWKGTKSIITFKNITSSVTISQRENLITNPYDIANIFNNYFSSVSDTAKKNIIKYSNKHFSDYLHNQCSNSIFIQPIDSEETANIISNLNMNKPVVQTISLIKYQKF